MVLEGLLTPAVSSQPMDCPTEGLLGKETPLFEALSTITSQQSEHSGADLDRLGSW